VCGDAARIYMTHLSRFRGRPMSVRDGRHAV
jgi:hypothetical protein